jgi:biotin transporter BioY
MGVLLIAMTCSPLKSFLSLLAWISLAAAGLPVLAGSVVGSIITRPTAGYLWGMLIAATLMSAAQFYGAGFFNNMFSKKPQQQNESLSFPASILVGSIGAIITLAMGWVYLSQFYGSVIAWTSGVMPFLIPELLKIVAVSFFISTFQLGKIAR